MVCIPVCEQLAYRTDYDRYDNEIISVRKTSDVVILSSLCQSLQAFSGLGFDEGKISLIVSNARSPIIGAES